MDYIELNLLEMLDTYGEDRLQFILSRFMCPQNIDVENFIQTKAIGFARQRLAMTYLVFSDEELPDFVGYFTLANKFVSINGNALSKTLQKRIGKFSQYDKELDRFLVSMPLIAQLGRNFNPGLSASISGQELLSIACDKVREAQFIIGGKAVYIECASNPKLYDFYSASQFVQFGQRERDRRNCGKSDIGTDAKVFQRLRKRKMPASDGASHVGSLFSRCARKLSISIFLQTNHLLYRIISTESSSAALLFHSHIEAFFVLLYMISHIENVFLSLRES